MYKIQKKKKNEMKWNHILDTQMNRRFPYSPNSHKTKKKRIQLVKFIMRCMIGILKKEFKIRTHSGLEGLRIENTHKTLKSNKPHGTKPHEKKKEEKQWWQIYFLLNLSIRSIHSYPHRHTHTHKRKYLHINQGSNFRDWVRFHGVKLIKRIINNCMTSVKLKEEKKRKFMVINGRILDPHFTYKLGILFYFFFIFLYWLIISSLNMK